MRSSVEDGGSRAIADEEVNNLQKLEVSQGKLRDVVSQNLANLAELEELREQHGTPEVQAETGSETFVVNNYYDASAQGGVSYRDIICDDDELLLYDDGWECAEIEDFLKEADITSSVGSMINLLAGKGIATYVDADGNTFDINESITSLTDNGDGTLTYTNEAGQSMIFSEALTTFVSSISGNHIGTYTDEQGNATDVFETITSLIDNGDNTISYVNESGEISIINLTPLLDNTDDQIFTEAALVGTVLRLTLEDGNSAVVDLATLLDNTDEQIISLTGTTLTLSGGTGANTSVELMQLLDNTDTLLSLSCTNTQIASYNATSDAWECTDTSSLETLTTLTNTVTGNRIGTYTDEDGNTTDIFETVTDISTTGSTITYTKEDGTTTTVDIKDLETTTTVAVNTTAQTITYTDEDGGTTTINVTDLETTTTLTDNSDGSFTYTNEDGTSITFTETLTTLVDNANGTLTYTNEDGTTTTVDHKDFTIDASVTYTDGKLSCSNTDEVLHWSGTLWSCDTVDNLVTHSTLTDNTDGTFTHTSGSGTVTVLDHKDMAVDGTTALYTDGKISCATDEYLLQWDTTNAQWTCVDITAIETTTTLVIDTANQRITYTNEDGTATVVDFTSLETLTTLTNTIAGHRIGTYTDEDGNTFDIHETITDISTTGSTFTYTKEDGTTTTIDIQNLETTTTLVDNNDGSFTYTNEDGTTTTWTETLTSIAASGSEITYTDEDGNDTVIDIKDLETTTTLTQNANGTLTYTDEDGNDTTVAAQSFVQGGGDITVTGTGSNADPYVISFTEVHTTLTDLLTTGNTIGTYTNENGDTYTIRETITGLAAGTNSLDYTDEAGNTTNIDLSSYIDTYTNGSGLSLTGNTFAINAPTCSGTDKLQWNGSAFMCSTDIDTLRDLSCSAGQIASYNTTSSLWECTDASSLETTTTLTNTITGNRIGTYTDEDGNTTDIYETITDISTTGSTFTYTKEDGTTTTVDIKDLETLTSVSVNTTNQTLTYTDEDGGTTTVDITQLETTTTLVDNNDGSFTYTNEDGTAVTFTETLTTLIDNANGTLTYTNEDGTTTTVDHKDFTIDASVTYTDGKLSCANTDEVLHWSGTLWSCDTVDNLVTHSTLTDNTDGTFTHTSGSGTVTVLDHKDMAVDGTTALYTDGKISCATDEYLLQWDATNTQWTCVDITAIETTTTLVIDTANQRITYTNEDGTATVVDFTSLETLTTLTNTIAGNRIGTYTDEDGNTFDIHETITDISTTGSTFTYTKEDGTTTTVDIQNLETTTTLVDNNDGSFTYTNEDGTTTTWTETLTSIAASGSEITYTDEDGNDTVIDIKDLETTTTLTQNANGTLTYTDEDGNDTTVAAQSFVQGGGDITVTGTGSNADPYVISFTEVHTTLTDLLTTGNIIGTYTNEDSTTYTIRETITGLALNTNSLDYTDEAGNTTNIDLSSYIDTYTNGSGLSLTGNTFAINAPTCSGTDKLQWNGSAFVCSSDVDTDDQTLGLAGNILSITDGNTVDLSTYLDNTDVLAGLSCVDGELPRYNTTTSAWECAQSSLSQLTCLNGEALTYNTTTSAWECATVMERVVYGANNPNTTAPAGTFQPGDTYIQTADGTSTGEVDLIWVYDGTKWVAEGVPAVSCDRREVLSNNGQAVINTEGEAVIYDSAGTVVFDNTSGGANVGTAYSAYLLANSLTVSETVNCYDDVCRQVGNVHYNDADGDNVFEPVNGDPSQTRAQLDTAGATACSAISCQQVYEETSNPVNGGTGLPTNVPQCTDLAAGWVDDGSVVYTWSVADQEWKVAEATAGTCPRATVDAAGSLLDDNGVTSVTRTATGRYTVTFATPQAHANYQILTSVIESAALRDDIEIQIVDGSKTITGFQVQITEQDNGGTAGTYRDRDWHFSVPCDAANPFDTLTCADGEVLAYDTVTSDWICADPLQCREYIVNTTPDGTVNRPFTEMGHAHEVTTPGVYHFDLDDDGTNDFSTYVDTDGWIQVVIDPAGSGSGALAQGTALDNSNRGILNATTLATLTDATAIRVNHQGGTGLDTTHTDSAIISRIINNQILNTGAPDNTLHEGWVGTGSLYLNNDASCTTLGSYGTTLDAHIAHGCGNATTLNWSPSQGWKAFPWTTNISTGSLRIWLRASASVPVESSLTATRQADDSFLGSDSATYTEQDLIDLGGACTYPGSGAGSEGGTTSNPLTYTSGAADPTTPGNQVGDWYKNTADNTTFMWNGAAWELVYNQESCSTLHAAYESTATINVNGSTTATAQNLFANDKQNDSFDTTDLTTKNSDAQIEVNYDGLYEISLNGLMNSAVQRANVRYHIFINGVQAEVEADNYIRQFTNEESSVNISFTEELSAGDVIEIRTSQEAVAGAVNLFAGAETDITLLDPICTDDSGIGSSGAGDEPWFGTDDNAGATSNTEDVYMMGNIGVGTSTLSAGKVATFAGDVDIQGVLDPTKLLFSNAAGTNSSFIPQTDGEYEVEFTEGLDLEFKSNTTDNILYMANGGNVGINTDTPLAPLHTVGALTAQVQAQHDATRPRMGMRSYYDGTSDRLLFYTDVANSTFPIDIYADSPSQILTLRAGNVGVGTNNPSAKLDVVQNTDGGQIATFEGDEGYGLTIRDMTTTEFTGDLASLATHTRGILIKGPNSANTVWDIDGNDNSDGFHITRDDGTDVVFAAKESGRVGIGEISPTHTLDIDGTVRVRTLPTSTSATSVLVPANNGGDNVLHEMPVQNILQYTNIATVGNLSGGQIPTGYTGYADWNGSWTSPITLPSSGSHVGQVFTINHIASLNTVINTANTSMTSALTITFAMRGAAFVWNGGRWNLITNGTGYTNASDARYKENIQPIGGALQSLLEVQPKQYIFKQEYQDPFGMYGEKTGFIAQELEEVYPHLVHDDYDGYKSVDYQGLIAIITQAIQEMWGVITSLIERIEQLEAANGITSSSRPDVATIIPQGSTADHVSATFAGQATILQGESATSVVFEDELSHAPYVTATANTGFALYNVRDISQYGFTIVTAEAVASDLSFTWHAILKGEEEVAETGEEVVEEAVETEGAAAEEAEVVPEAEPEAEIEAENEIVSEEVESHEAQQAEEITDGENLLPAEDTGTAQ